MKQAIEEMLNACETCNVILHDNVRNMKNAMDDGVDCILHTLKLAAHEGLLSQCSFINSTANASKVVGQCCNSICRITKSHMEVDTLFQQNKKNIKEQLGRR